MAFIQKELVFRFLVEEHMQIRTEIPCYQLLWLGLRSNELVLEGS